MSATEGIRNNPITDTPWGRLSHLPGCGTAGAPMERTAAEQKAGR
jgi:hypothetical protein